MAPTSLLPAPVNEQVEHIYRSISSILPILRSRDLDSTTLSTTPITSIFAVLNHVKTIDSTSSLSSRAVTSLCKATRNLLPPLDPSASIGKRQTQILAIPSAYAGLNSGPAPGAVVGIVLGSVLGFLLILLLIYAIVSATGGGFGGRAGGGGGTIIEEEIIRRRSGSPSRRSRARSEMEEVLSSPPRRRESRRAAADMIDVEEEHISRSRLPSTSRPPPVDESVRDEDIVEVIEEHSPERSAPPPRRESRRESKRMSGYRTVDPAEFGGGGRRMRRVRD